MKKDELDLLIALAAAVCDLNPGRSAEIGCAMDAMQAASQAEVEAFERDDHPLYGPSLGGLVEPKAGDAQTSIAISLKRIADLMDRQKEEGRRLARDLNSTIREEVRALLQNMRRDG